MTVSDVAEKRRYPLGSKENALCKWTREQLIRSRDAINLVLADDEREHFLPKEKEVKRQTIP
jgi:hypothetical protein